MIVFLLAALQATPLPDIELRATVRARSLTIEKRGAAEVTVTADGRNVVAVEGPKANGRKRIDKPAYRVDIEARIADPAAAPGTEEIARPQ